MIIFLVLGSISAFMLILLNCLLTPHQPWQPPSHEDEVAWLMKDHKLSKEEAEEIANLLWPK